MRALPLCALVMSCGRFGFDPGSPGADAELADTPGDAADLLRGCMVRMAMDEPAWTGAANEVEDTCGGHHGTAIGGATTANDPVRGRVGAFAGGSSCVQIADASMLQPTTSLTMSAWILPTALSPNGFGVISRRDDFGVNTSYSAFVWLDSDGAGTTNQLYVDIDSENDRVADPTTTFLAAWHQITIVYDGLAQEPARLRFYVDGALSFVAPETSATIAPGNPATPLSIGCLPLGAPAQGWVGSLDEVVLWDRALPADEVAGWHAATLR